MGCAGAQAGHPVGVRDRSAPHAPHTPNCSRKMRSSRLCPGSNSIAHRDAVLHTDVDGLHEAHLVVVGDRRDRAFGGFQDLDRHDRGIRQQRPTPAPRPKRADRRQCQQRRPDRDDRPLRGEVVGGGTGRRCDHDSVGVELGQALLAVHQDAQARHLIGLAEQRHLIDGTRRVGMTVGVDRPHGERVDHALLGRRQAVGQRVLAVLVHHEADGTAVHTVDRLAGSHEFVQGLQHQAVAAECDDDVGLLWRHIAVTARQRLAGHDGLGARTGNKRDAIAALAHGLTCVGADGGRRGLSILPRRQPPEDWNGTRGVRLYDVPVGCRGRDRREPTRW